MQVATLAARLRRAVLILGILCGVWTLQPPARGEAEPSEVRALWVTRSSLNSPASITALVRSAADHGFNTLLVQVRGRADAYYTSAIEPRGTELGRQPRSFDPLATVLTEAHER